jgi:hypothetical protein
MVNIENLRAINGGKSVEVEYLGSVLWYTVSDVLKIPTDDLQLALTDNNLEKFMPRKVNPKDAFRRVTKSFEVKQEPFGKNMYINLLVRDVRAQEGKAVRQLVREIVDGKNTRLEYRPVIQFEIEKENLTITPLVDNLTNSEKDIAERLPQLHEDALNYYDGTHIRYMLHMILKNCNPVSVRPNGGVKFIPQKEMDTVNAVKKLSKQLNNYDGNVKVWSIPVIDAAEHREMVGESLEAQVIEGSNSLIQEMKNIVENSSKQIGIKAAQGYAERIKKMQEVVREYEEMLEYQATRAQENLNIAQKLAVKLLESVSIDE